MEERKEEELEEQDGCLCIFFDSVDERRKRRKRGRARVGRGEERKAIRGAGWTCECLFRFFK